MRVAVGIATSGRPDVVAELVGDLQQQTRAPDLVVICPAKPADLPWAGRIPQKPPVEITTGGFGLTAQRNAILKRLGGFDIVVFFDDDFFPAPDYIENVVSVFASEPDVVMVTGDPIADGALGPGVRLAEARTLLAAHRPPKERVIETTFSGYGCNMAIRLAPLFAHGLEFDEALPLYGWLEDMEFSRKIAPHGRVAKSNRLAGVHLAVKSGRVSGLRYGYSQIANPVYLFQKELIPFGVVLSHAGKNLVSNILRSLRPEPYVDRKGRLKGNLMAIRDVAARRCDPRAILKL